MNLSIKFGKTLKKSVAIIKAVVQYRKQIGKLLRKMIKGNHNNHNNYNDYLATN